MSKVEFPLPLKNLKEFRAQVQPLERVEIAGVALDRDKPLEGTESRFQLSRDRTLKLRRDGHR